MLKRVWKIIVKEIKKGAISLHQLSGEIVNDLLSIHANYTNSHPQNMLCISIHLKNPLEKKKNPPKAYKKNNKPNTIFLKDFEKNNENNQPYPVLQKSKKMENVIDDDSSEYPGLFNKVSEIDGSKNREKSCRKVDTAEILIVDEDGLGGLVN